MHRKGRNDEHQNDASPAPSGFHAQQQAKRERRFWPQTLNASTHKVTQAGCPLSRFRKSRSHCSLQPAPSWIPVPRVPHSWDVVRSNVGPESTASNGRWIQEGNQRRDRAKREIQSRRRRAEAEGGEASKLRRSGEFAEERWGPHTGHRQPEPARSFLTDVRLFSHTWRHLIEHQKKILFSESIFYFPLRLSTGEVLVEYVALAQISFFLYLLCFIFVECMH